MALNPGLMVHAAATTVASVVAAIAQTDYRKAIAAALETIKQGQTDSVIRFKLKMRDADISDYWPFWLVLMMVAGLTATLGFQGIAQKFHIDWLQKVADFLWYGGMLNNKIWHGELWRGVTSGFLHGGLFHIFSNSIGFLFGAYMVNHCFKGRGWMIIFFGSQFIGSLATTAINPATEAVGASIGLMGLFGAMVSAQIRYYWVKPTGRPAAYLMTLSSLLIQLALQLVIEHLVPNVGHMAHATGLAAGLVLGFLLPINAGMAVYATRKGIARISSASTKKRKGGREFLESVEIEISPEFNPATDALYELKMSRN